MTAAGDYGRRGLMWRDLTCIAGEPWVGDYLGQWVLLPPIRKPAQFHDLVYFGKYCGHPATDLLADRGYVDWLLAQRWFPKKHPDLFARAVQAKLNPLPEPQFGAPIFSCPVSGSTRPIQEYLDANVTPLYHHQQYRILGLVMDDDPTKVYVYRDRAKSSVYYAVNEPTGIIKIGTARSPELRMSVLQYSQGIPGPWRLAAFEMGSRKLESARHKQFAEHRVGYVHEGHAARELFKPAPALLEHIAKVLDGNREWPRPEPHTDIRVRGGCPFTRVVLADRAPSPHLTSVELPGTLTVDGVKQAA